KKNERISGFSLFLLGLLTFFLPAISYASGGNSDGFGLVTIVGIAIVTASLLTILFTRLKLPALLAYISSGLIIGIFAGDIFGETIHMLNEVSHIGLVFLLFIIGMEMDPTAIRLLGVRTGIVIALQGPISIGGIYGLQWMLYQAGYSIPGLGSNPDAWIYYAVAASLGSTAVVIKLLGDKFDLGSQAGKITVVTLIIEDIWAVLALSHVKSLGGNAEGSSALVMIVGGILLASIFIVSSRFLLSRVLAYLSRSPDLLMLVSLGWCFLCAESMAQVGLSAEIGALIAGVTIGRLPQHSEIFTKVESLRDFFMALFFVALGISLPVPTFEVIGLSLALVAIVIISRLVLYTPTLLAAKQGPIVSFAVAINLSQLSVFGMLIVQAGIASNMLTEHDRLVLYYAFLFSVIISSFSIFNNYRLAMIFSRLLGLRADKKYAQKKTSSSGESHQPAEVIILGLHVNTEAIARYLEKNNPELLEKILVIDFNLDKHKSNKCKNLRIAYGDFSNPDTLRHYGIQDAKVVVSTINNAFLHGTRNEKLIDVIKDLNPSIRIVTTSLSTSQSEQLKKRGAYACISTPDESAPAYTTAINDALTFK
ncbi:MAG: cation:proton antiporter, partial [Gammaproteobacteria bacterium]|nr:cation:proton antiporter [Gammaproteobacteria bacterium]